MNRSRSAGPGRRRARLLGIVPLIVAPLVAMLEPGAASAASAPAPTGQRTIVVQFDPAVTHISSILGSVHASRAVPATGERYVLSVPAGQAAGVKARLAAEPGVVYADVARPVHAAVTPDDQCYTSGCVANEGLASGLRNQNYLNTIGAPAAWNVSKGSGVTIAVIDSGVDPNQPDLQGKLVPHGSSFEVNVCGTSAQPDPLCQPARDELGHGTHVSGLAGADTNNTVGVASLGWNVRLDEYQVLDSQGNGNTADVATAIYDAVRAGDRVISMSLANYSCGANPSDCGPDPDEAAAVEYAIAHNVVVAAAAGNDGMDSPAYPASYPGVLSVAATDNSGAVQDFSQWGSAANIAAPGSHIVSTWPTYTVNDPDTGMPSPCSSLCVESGTSMATPLVSAAAALVLSKYPSLSSAQVVKVLESSARPTAGGHPIYGGLLNVPAALSAGAHPPSSYNGYVMAGADGSAYSFGSVGAFGDVGGTPLSRPVVGAALVPDGRGYWMVASDGGVFSFGDAGFHGSTGGVRLNKPIVGMAPTLDGRGYWLVASDGGIFAFGDARFYGSTGGITLNKPVVGMAATADGRGYWLVASDGGIFAFGDARFYGSTGGITLNKPVVGMAAAPGGTGYWMVASDGGVFAFGHAGFHGSTGGITLARPVVGLAATPSGQGYWMVASDGGVFNYGDARFYGSTGGQRIPAPVVGIAD